MCINFTEKVNSCVIKDQELIGKYKNLTSSVRGMTKILNLATWQKNRHHGAFVLYYVGRYKNKFCAYQCSCTNGMPFAIAISDFHFTFIYTSNKKHSF